MVKRSGLPRIRLHDLRHTHATPAFTMATYQHVLPGMQSEAAQTFAELLELLAASTR